MSDLRQLKRQSRALLSELGSSPDEVSESLKAAGVRGVPRSNRSCAIALYLSALMGSDPRVRTVRVGHCAVLIDMAKGPENRPNGRLLVQLPKPVRQFVAAFDALEYPMVVRPCPAEPLPAAVASARARME